MLAPEITFQVSAELLKAVQTAFFSERDSFIQEVEKNAKSRKVDKYSYYAGLVFQSALESRVEYAKSRQEKVLRSAIGVLIASGKTEQEARKMLGLGE